MNLRQKELNISKVGASWARLAEARLLYILFFPLGCSMSTTRQVQLQSFRLPFAVNGKEDAIELSATLSRAELVLNESKGTWKFLGDSGDHLFAIAGSRMFDDA